MARSKRVEYPSACYHVMCRGNDGKKIFLSDDGRRLWLMTLGEVCAQTGWNIHAYALMSNHYHLLIETPEANLVAGMKWFQGTYTQRFNAMFRCRGHLFQGRYKALPIETGSGLEYFRTVSNYIHLNPFRAGICGEGLASNLQSYKWSSYPAYIGQVRKRPPWLQREKVLKTWGIKEGAAGALRMYREKIERMMKFENDPVAGWCGDIDRQLKRGWFVGSEEFREMLFSRLSGGGDNFRGEQRREYDEREAERLLTASLQLLGMTESKLWERKGTDPEKRAVAWLLKTQTTVSVTWIAARIKMGQRTTASRGISEFSRSSRKVDKVLRVRIAQVTG